MPGIKPTRRTILQGMAGLGLGMWSGLANGQRRDEEVLPPVRLITRGPKHHWFGYYDKLQFDPTGRFVLGMQVEFEHRSPRADDVIRIGIVDLADHDRWIDLGQSSAWCWQQGCMLQWLPGSHSKIVWNDREQGTYITRIMDVLTREMQTVPRAIYALSPDGRHAVSTDFRRLADTRPGYGYNGIPDPAADHPAPDNDGIFLVDLERGTDKLIFSFAQIAEFGPRMATMEGAKHKFNHLLFNPDGSRFVFLHRWRGPLGRETRMLTATPDGKDLRIVDANGLTSHFIWRDPQHILAYSRHPSHGARFYLFEDGGSERIEVVGADVMTADGHCSYLPGNEWILNDTYPDQDFVQHPYLFHVATGRKVVLGHFRSSAEYTGEWRCDTHPRFSPDGKSVIIDSPAASAGRQLHLIDIRSIVATP